MSTAVRWIAATLGVVLAASSAHGQDTPGFHADASWTAALEPASGAPELGPNTVLHGRFAAPGEVDRVALRLDRDAVVSLGAFPEDGVAFARIDAPSIRRSFPTNGQHPTALFRVRVTAGLHELVITASKRSRAGGYRVLVQVEAEDPTWEVESDDQKAAPMELAPGAPRRGTCSSWSDTDRYAIAVERRTIYRLTVRRLATVGAPPASPLELRLDLGDGEDAYLYRMDLADQDALCFYPVLEPGKHSLDIGFRPAWLGGGYELLVEPMDVVVTVDDVAQAHRAIERAIAWLVAPEAADKHREHHVAHTGLALAALIESGPPALEALREREVVRHIGTLARRYKAVPGGRWDGTEVQSASPFVYDAAIATLALALAVSAGHEAARAPCVEGVRYLLAAQLSAARSDAWGKVLGGAHHGSWRYDANARVGDLSVVGWCLIALYAADAAGVKVPGLQAAVERGVAFIGHCADPDAGYRYQPGLSARPSSVQQSIGALLSTLLDTPSPALEAALVDLDRHLCAATQVGRGEDTPFYYFYYATRLHYLRGGFPWEAWRRVTIHQLTRRQRPDGGWTALRREADQGDRYATALAVMILRLCVNEAPAYLRQEVEGF